MNRAKRMRTAPHPLLPPLVAVLTISAAAIAAACTSSAAVDRKQLIGPWFSDGPSFVIEIGEHAILFEQDMLEHPYQLDGDLLSIEFYDGPRLWRILRLTSSELVLRDEQVDTVFTLYRQLPGER